MDSNVKSDITPYQHDISGFSARTKRICRHALGCSKIVHVIRSGSYNKSRSKPACCDGIT